MLMQLVRLAFWALVIYLVGRRFMVMARVAEARRAAAPDPRGSEPPPQQPAADSPYVILGVTNTSTSAEIRTAYQALVRKYHPDLVATMPVEFREVAEKKTKEINAAYSQLKRWGVVS